MTTKERVSLSVDASTKKQLETSAHELGLSVSGYVEKLARDARIREAGRRFKEYLANMGPEDKAQYDKDRAIIDRMTSDSFHAMIAKEAA